MESHTYGTRDTGAFSPMHKTRQVAADIVNFKGPRENNTVGDFITSMRARSFARLRARAPWIKRIGYNAAVTIAVSGVSARYDMFD